MVDHGAKPINRGRRNYSAGWSSFARNTKDIDSVRHVHSTPTAHLQREAKLAIATTGMQIRAITEGIVIELVFPEEVAAKNVLA